MSRRYAQYCPVARSLDVIGGRWTLLIARELLLGPLRFTDLADGLPGIGVSVLADRLKHLEGHGLIAKRTLPPPAASVVYELTAEALGLARILAAMADWGMQLLGQPADDDEVKARWLVLGLSVTATVEDGSAVPDAACELHVDEEIFTIKTQAGHLQPSQGPAPDPDATITLSTDTLVAIAGGDLDIPSSRADRLIEVDGDASAAEHLLTALTGVAGD
jgi:DNA-binding HxlR family transcriptional regulator